jgi:hypothetical protein
MSVNSRLCGVCLTLIPVLTDTSKHLYDHHSSLGSLYRAAAAGCPICTFLVDCHLSDPSVDEKQLPEHYLDNHHNAMHEVSVKYEIDPGSVSNGTKVADLTFYTTVLQSRRIQIDDMIASFSIVPVHSKLSRKNTALSLMINYCPYSLGAMLTERSCNT